MSMMKVDVTAENKPAYYPTSVRFTKRPRCVWSNTHKYQRVIQVFVAFLEKVAVVIVGYLVELIVEFNGRVAGRPQRTRKESR